MWFVTRVLLRGRDRGLSRAAALLLALFLAPLAAGPATAGKRVALVIGNSAYAKVARLPNPARDAVAVEAMLKAAGFEVRRANDLGSAAMRRALRDFSDQVRDADIAAVFYAGHGMEVNGANYLIPVDAVLERDMDVEDEAVALDRVAQVLEPAKRLRLVILDACRDNPFVRSMKRTVATRSIGRGLAKVEVLTTDTLFAYAARAGSTAEDGDGQNSPFTTALVKHLATPGLDLRIAFGRVRDEVLAATGRRQEPFVYGSLGGSEVALVAASPTLPPTSANSGTPNIPVAGADPTRVCREVEAMTSLSVLAVLERQHKGTPAADCVAARIEELKKAQAATAKTAEAERQRVAAEQREKASAEQRERVALLQKQQEDEARKKAEAEAAAKKRVEQEETAKRDPALGVKPGSGQSFRDCPTCPEMVVAPAGGFTMGSPASEKDRFVEEDQLRVMIARPFAAGKFAVTRAEFAAFVQETGHKTESGCYSYTGSEWKQQADKSWASPGFTQDDRHPVVCVNWDDAKAYAAWLSKQTGKDYRLLSEAEREYVTRAGTTGPFWWGAQISTSQANYNGNATYANGSKGEYRQKTVPVDSFKPNPWGLYNVHGNVWEWTEDCSNDNNAGNPGDGSARTSGNCSRRVVRGGSWVNNPGGLRAALRYGSSTDYRNYGLGFRVGRTF